MGSLKGLEAWKELGSGACRRSPGTAGTPTSARCASSAPAEHSVTLEPWREPGHASRGFFRRTERQMWWTVVPSSAATHRRPSTSTVSSSSVASSPKADQKKASASSVHASPAGRQSDPSWNAPTASRSACRKGLGRAGAAAGGGPSTHMAASFEAAPAPAQLRVKVTILSQCSVRLRPSSSGAAAGAVPVVSRIRRTEPGGNLWHTSSGEGTPITPAGGRGKRTQRMS